ncbi:MAG: heme exporter protein CcmB [Leptospiraceae bacterium]|nr:heme exporter protein CcmB [Leptospiraceae bacterium]
MPGIWLSTWRTFFWEMRQESKHPGSILFFLSFAVSLNVIYFYAFGRSTMEKHSPGALLLSLFFVSVVLLSRGHGRDREGGALKVALASSIDKLGFYVGRVLARALILLAILLLSWPISGILVAGRSLSIPGLESWIRTLCLFGLAALALSSLGVIVVFLAAGNRFKEMIVPVLFFPAALPLFMVVAGAFTTDGNVVGGQLYIRLVSVVGLMALFYMLVGSLFSMRVSPTEAG